MWQRLWAAYLAGGTAPRIFFFLSAPWGGDRGDEKLDSQKICIRASFGYAPTLVGGFCRDDPLLRNTRGQLTQARQARVTCCYPIHEFF